MVRVFLDRLERARRPRRGDPRRLPAHGGPGRGARSRAAGRGPSGRPGDLHRRRSRGPRPADVQSPDLHGQRARLQPEVESAARGRASATSTARSSSSARRRRGDGPSADEGAAPAAPRGRRSLPQDAASCQTVDGREPISDVSDRLLRALETAPGEDRRVAMVTRKSRREIDKMRHAGRIVAEVLALVESELKPGVTTGHLDRLAERHIRAAGRGALVQGLRPPQQPVSGQPVHLDRRRGRPRHSRRPGRSATARSSRSTPARSSTAGTATARGRSSSASRRPRSGSLVETTRLAMMAGIAAAVPGGSPRRHLRRRSRTSPRRTATASSASSSATGSAPRCTRSRRSPTTGRASAA